MLLVIETKQKVYFVKCQLKLSEILKNMTAQNASLTQSGSLSFANINVMIKGLPPTAMYITLWQLAIFACTINVCHFQRLS